MLKRKGGGADASHKGQHLIQVVSPCFLWMLLLWWLGGGCQLTCLKGGLSKRCLLTCLKGVVRWTSGVTRSMPTYLSKQWLVLKVLWIEPVVPRGTWLLTCLKGGCGEALAEQGGGEYCLVGIVFPYTMQHASLKWNAQCYELFYTLIQEWKKNASTGRRDAWNSHNSLCTSLYDTSYNKWPVRMIVCIIVPPPHLTISGAS